MIRLVLLLLLFLLSLLAIFKAPTNGLWYLSIAVTEFPWVFACLIVLLLFWRSGSSNYYVVATGLGILSLFLLAIPIIGAYRIVRDLRQKIDVAFSNVDAPAESNKKPFHLALMITGIGATKVAYKTLAYNSDTVHPLTLNFYAAQKEGNRPCVVIVHGGSWAGGTNLQLPELNSYLAKKGYHVAAINYRLAPAFTFPAPVEDVRDAIAYLRKAAASLHIDTTNFILIGRSAGAQVALTAAYSRKEPGLKGVINFYGPADMIWGYGNPASPLVMNSRLVMETYLGGTYQQLPRQYSLSSPIELVTAQAPPTLMIHGQNDPLVAYGHSTRLSKVLTRYRIPHFLLTLPWATHGCDYTLNGPGGQLATYAVERFIQLVTAP